MKKRIVSIVLVLALAVCVFPFSAFADSSDDTLQPFYYDEKVMHFYGASNHYYRISYNDMVGYNHIETGDPVKVCQAFINAVFLKYSQNTGNGVTLIDVDGIWGPTSEEALREAQSICGVTRDGVCGPNTWKALRTYAGGITSTVKSYL